MINAYRIWWESQKEGDHLMIILKLVLKKDGVEARIGLFWLRIG
jgi:hypothetical protein